MKLIKILLNKGMNEVPTKCNAVFIKRFSLKIKAIATNLM